MWFFIKIFLTIFTIILIPTYIPYYGVQNFLWLSDVGLFLTVIALWLNSPLIMSMAAVGVLILELFWCLDFFVRLFFKHAVTDLSAYMFDAKYSLFIRAISFFHIFVPLIWIFYLHEFGYDQRALYYFTLLYWIVLAVTYSCTPVKDNINWVFMTHHNKNISPLLWFLVLCIGFPLLIFFPMHFILKFLFTN